MRPRDVLAGALLVNAVPHAVVGCSRGRSLTPFGGADSGPVANLAWAALNVAVAALALGSGGTGRGDVVAVDERRRSVQLGAAVMAVAGLGYEMRSAARSRSGG